MTAPLRIEYRRCAVEESLDLRFRTLILGTSRTAPHFDKDGDLETRHYGAFNGGECVGCLRLNLSEWEGKPAWQLRGMAVEERFRGMRIGESLMMFAIEEVGSDRPIRLFWCNARKPAVGFYSKQGWKVVSDRFQVEGVGPHYKMVYEPPTVG